MKRSEMLKLMLDHMWNPPERVRGMHDGGQQSIIMMDLLLDKLEDAGMLPPMHKDYKGNLDKHPRGYEWESE